MTNSSLQKTVTARRLVLVGPQVVLTALCVLLAGCGHDEAMDKSPSVNLVEPAQRHPILVSQQPSNLTVPVPKGSSGLSPKERANVLAFAQHFKAGDSGDSRLIIQAPSGSGNEIAAMQAVQQVRALLSDNGFAESSISLEAYDAARHSEAPIKVSYMKYVAEGPDCGHWPKNVAYEPNNIPMANIGCANQHNLAAMIANPADLIGPRSETPRSGERRDIVWDKYQKGDITATGKSDDGKVSTTGN